mgnify:FL=1
MEKWMGKHTSLKKILKKYLNKRNVLVYLPLHSLTNIKQNGKSKIISRTESYEGKASV